MSSFSPISSPNGPVPVPYPNASAGVATVNPKMNKLVVKGATIPISQGDEAGAAGGVTTPAQLRDTAIKYNPKLDPKYDARSLSAGAFAQDSKIRFDPRAGKGVSLVGHELTHVVQQ